MSGIHQLLPIKSPPSAASLLFAAYMEDTASFWTSLDGVTWNAGTVPGVAIATLFADRAKYIFLGGGKILFIGAGSNVAVSSTGSSWTITTTANQLNITNGATTWSQFLGRWFNCSGSGTGVYNSPDGISWSTYVDGVVGGSFCMYSDETSGQLLAGFAHVRRSSTGLTGSWVEETSFTGEAVGTDPANREVYSITRGIGGLYACGSLYVTAGGTRRPVIWKSTDNAVNWTVVYYDAAAVGIRAEIIKSNSSGQVYARYGAGLDTYVYTLDGTSWTSTAGSPGTPLTGNSGQMYIYSRSPTNSALYHYGANFGATFMSYISGSAFDTVADLGVAA